MHQDKKMMKTEAVKRCGSENSFEEIIAQGANKVIENLLENIDDIKDNEEEMIQDVTLEEVADLASPKKYYNECEKCGFLANASRRYVALQQLLKHKELCTGSKTNRSEIRKTCTQCKYVGSDAIGMKRHMRDEHNIKKDSISPPHKKQKQAEVGTIAEAMEMKIKYVKDLSESFEEMEIDETNSGLELLSEAMDRKIKDKEKSNIESEKRIMEKRKEAERKKETDEEIIRLNNKKRKQSLKDLRKANNKKNKKNENTLKKANNPKNVPNIREIPNNCRKHVKEDDVMYVVPGNGACAANSAAALLFGDEVFGPKLRSRMNQHLAKFFYTRYQNITQCSPGHPFVRKLAGGEVSFTNPEELISFLTKSTDAELVWCDSEDLSVIADFYQIKTQIITRKGEEDENPIVNWIYPDESMKEHAELKEVDLGEMILFHEDDCHFNLIISRDSDLATLGSLSHRFKIGPKEPEDKDKEVGKNNTNDNKEEESKIKDLENELKKTKENLRKIQNNYIQCEKELRKKTEEVEILKVEIKDLKLLKELKEKTVESDDVKEMKKCSNCDFKTNSSEWLRNHLENVHKNRRKNVTIEKTKNWPKCEVKAQSTGSLESHEGQEHEIEKNGSENNIKKCGDCDFLTNSTEWMKKHVELLHKSK